MDMHLAKAAHAEDKLMTKQSHYHVGHGPHVPQHGPIPAPAPVMGHDYGHNPTGVRSVPPPVYPPTGPHQAYPPTGHHQAYPPTGHREIKQKNGAERNLVTGRDVVTGKIRREIATMKLIKHPNLVQLYELMASKTKIFIILEYVTEGELSDKIVNEGRMKENEARRYFQQLIHAVDYCHSRGVYHRDLNDDGLLHTSCGTPNYVAPEVLNDRGYDGATADMWSCGVILYLLLADFNCPPWLSLGAMKLITRILDPNLMTRVTPQEVFEGEWFKKDYKPPVFEEKDYSNMDDIDAVFKDSEEHLVTEKKEEQPAAINAFEIICLIQNRITLRGGANEIIEKIEEAAKPLGFDVQKKNYKMRLENVKAGRKGHLNVATEIFQVAPSLHMVQVSKLKEDTLEFHKFYKKLSNSLEQVVWANNKVKKETVKLKLSLLTSLGGALLQITEEEEDEQQVSDMASSIVSDLPHQRGIAGEIKSKNVAGHGRQNRKCRKHKDLYMWMVKSPGGPSVKFLVNAAHTMESSERFTPTFDILIQF
ncbi:unnamed protein product [Arabidopsis arenosa]|uniref:non-specific serine/threonine protein kinase n=1 Tax=Arabidopsis arenosa TaxID=38785 RepID=A0A8S2ABW5_ARAAE|nr:unnamed protein product [Arabidopsis arenosa]